MKLFLKKIFGIGFLVMFVLGFSACGEDSKSSKYRFNANNGYFVDNGYLSSNESIAWLFWIKDKQVLSLSFDDGDMDVEGALPNSINPDTVLGIYYNDFIVNDGKKISFLDMETGKEDDLYVSFTLPEQKYNSIVVASYDKIIIQAGKKISIYENFLKEWKCSKEFSLDKEYESAFYLGKYFYGLPLIGLVKGNEIDLLSLEDYKDDGFSPKVIKTLVMDKQYDSYIVCCSDYDYMYNEDIPYLGCIKDNTLKFFDVKKGQAAKIIFSDEEMSWTF